MENSVDKKLYKVTLELLKVIPMLLAFCDALHTLLDLCDIDAPVISFIGGISFLNIAKDLLALGCPEEDVEEEMDKLSEFKYDTGYIYSNVNRKMSIIIIGPTETPEEFQDTIDHEKGHLAMHICIAENMEPFSEEFQYLNGMIGQQTFKVAKLFLCEHCREKL